MPYMLLAGPPAVAGADAVAARLLRKFISVPGTTGDVDVDAVETRGAEDPDDGRLRFRLLLGEGWGGVVIFLVAKSDREKS